MKTPIPLISTILAGVISLTSFTPFASFRQQKQNQTGTKDTTVKVTAEEADKQFAEDSAAVAAVLPGVVCWGDSLTAGAGGQGTTYPSTLEKLISENLIERYDLKTKLNASDKSEVNWEDYTLKKVTVTNFGIGGERSDTIVGRADAIPLTVEEFVIPAERGKVPFSFIAAENQSIEPLLQGDKEFNPVTVAGVKGKISTDTDPETGAVQYYFVRSKSGDEVKVEKGTAVVTAANEKYRDNIQVIMMGGNGGFNTVEELFAQYDALIARQTSNGERYIIVGYHGRLGAMAQYENIDELFEERYGEHYIRTIDYLLTDALADAGIEPTEDDLNDIAEGVCPSSLLVDGVHFNAAGYTLIGRLIYDRMDKLGYFDEVKAVCGIVDGQ